MWEPCRVGDLVHIPQAVTLVDCDNQTSNDPQLTIPLNMCETQKPEIGVVMNASEYGYVRVLVKGKSWTVKNDCVYTIHGASRD